MKLSMTLIESKVIASKRKTSLVCCGSKTILKIDQAISKFIKTIPFVKIMNFDMIPQQVLIGSCKTGTKIGEWWLAL